jgi:hypothetical protein
LGRAYRKTDSERVHVEIVNADLGLTQYNNPVRVGNDGVANTSATAIVGEEVAPTRQLGALDSFTVPRRPRLVCDHDLRIPYLARGGGVYQRLPVS